MCYVYSEKKPNEFSYKITGQTIIYTFNVMCTFNVLLPELNQIITKPAKRKTFRLKTLQTISPILINSTSLVNTLPP